MKKLLNFLAALLLLVAASAQGASVTLNSSANNVITANITPDATESGTVNVYMAASYAGLLLFRGATTLSWQQWTGGAFPVATTLSLAGGAKTVTVIDVDISSLPGLVIYVAYGKSDADVSLPGHLGQVYTVPTPTVTTTTTTTTTVRATTTTVPATTTSTATATTTTPATTTTTAATTTTRSTTTTTVASGGNAAQIARGKAVFNDPRFCIQCHSPVERVGRTAAQIQDAINGSVPAMSFLAALDTSDIQAVAAYLADPANF